MKNKIKQKIKNSERISSEEALYMYENFDLLELAESASIVRERKNSNKVVTYIIDRNINYTNICNAKCSFCAFYENEDSDRSYTLNFEEIGKKIEETIALDGVQILMQGGLNDKMGLSYYVELFTYIKKNYNIWIHGLSPPEIVHIANKENISIKETLEALIEAGLSSIPGGGAEILDDEVRKKIAPNKCNSQEWLDVMEVAHNLGLRTTATMMFGSVETIKDRISHLDKLRTLQDKTSGFTAFIPWSFQPDNTSLAGNKDLMGASFKKSSSYEYLKMLALSRIFLDNFDNIQVSWVTQGSKIAQLSLNFGGNDFGSLMIEENVVKAAGVSNQITIEEIEYNIKEAGFTPKRRNMEYKFI